MLWAGQPSGWRAFLRPADLFIIAFAVFAGVFFVVATVATPSRSSGPSDPSTSVLVFLFPIVFFGVFLIGPRLFSARREIDGTRYALTDRRVVIRGRRREIELDLANLQHLELERSWLSGPSIFFGTRQIYEGWGGMYGGSPAPAFRGLPDADAVYRLISEARAKALQR
jgi:Bacterial PH domain